MTAYVVLHHLSPSHVVTVSAEAAQLGAARVGLSVLGVRDEVFLDQIRSRGADVSSRPRRDSDLVFVLIDRPEGLARLKALEGSIKRSGAIWAVFPKGRKDIREVDLIAAGPAAGLVDNKVVRFSETHTALRFVVPLRRR